MQKIIHSGVRKCKTKTSFLFQGTINRKLFIDIEWKVHLLSGVNSWIYLCWGSVLWDWFYSSVWPCAEQVKSWSRWDGNVGMLSHVSPSVPNSSRQYTKKRFLVPTWAKRRFTGMWSLCNVSKDRKAFILHPSHSREMLNSLKWKWQVFSVTPGDQMDQITSCFKSLCRSASTVLLNPSCARIQLHVSKSTWN